ncbi:MAG: YhdP family protein [Gammaproteobacteria bacterium]
MTDAPAQTKPQSRGFLRTLWRLTFVGFAVVAVVLAIAIGLFRTLVPMVPGFHERIEAAAGNALGVPVTFERLDVRWRWRGPELVFFGARVLDTERGATLLEAADGHINLNVGAFISNRAVVPDFVVLRGLDIEVLRDHDGRFSVLGREAARGEAAPLGTADNWPLPDGLYVLREARVRYTRSGEDPVTVPRVNVNVEVDRRRLRIDGQIVPPQGMGDSVELSAELDRGINRDEPLAWQVYLAGSDLRLAALNDVLGSRALPFAQGNGDIVFWSSFEGLAIRNASVDLDVEDLTTNDGEAPYRHLRGRFELDRTPLGWRAQAHELYIDRGESAWPAVSASVSLDEGPGGERRIHAVVPFLRMEDVVPLLHAAPDSAWRQRVLEHALVGDVTDLDAIVQLAPQRSPRVSLSGDFRGIGWRSARGVPGVSGLGGSVRSDAAGGRLDIETDQALVDAPEIFERSLRAWRLTGAISWRAENTGWVFASDNIFLAADDFDALASVEMRVAPDTPPWIDARMDVGDLDIVAALKYLPTRAMKPKLVNWLNDSLREGNVRTGSVRVRGALDKFPFAEPEDDGEFLALLDIDNLALSFGRGWPVTTDVDSRVRFEGRELRATVSDGRFGQARVTSGQVVIDDFRDVVLDVEVATEAPLQDVNDYFVTTPAAGRYQKLLSDLRPSGPARTSVSLSMPLKTWREDLDYQVDIATSGAQLNYKDWPVALEDIRGAFVLTRDGFSAPAATGELLGRPVALAAETVPLQINGEALRVVSVRASGRTDANVLAERLHPPLGEIMRGGSDWQATIQFPPLTRPEALPTSVTVTSMLDGLALRLPTPLAKPADDAWPTTATLNFPPDSPVEGRIKLGSEITAALTFERLGGRWGMGRGTIALNDGAADFESRDGISVRGALAQFDVDAWLARNSDQPSSFMQQLRTIDVQVGELLALGQSVPTARIKLDRNVREWLIEIESDTASGAIFLPFDFKTTGGPVIANMQTLRWQSAEEAGGDAVDPRSLPSLRLDAQDFWFNDMNFGALSMQVGKVEEGLAIERMVTEAPSFDGEASGVWRYADGAPSEFLMTIRSTDVKSTLESLGSVGAIDSGEATFSMDLHWDDELDGGFVRDVYGNVSVAVSDGQLLNVDPKAGRVFGLISLTALPRRLSLDFRDVFQKGFAFDAIEGNFSLRGGNAFTDNLVLRGPAAQVAIVGRAGIANRDYDQTASVYANFGSSLPIAGAIAGGPAVGAALLIFTEVFKDPLKQISRVDYQISGPWDDPVVARLGPGATGGDRPQADPLPAEPAIEPQQDELLEGSPGD